MKTLFGLVLAGGLSRRMGENKVLLPFGASRLVDHVAQRLAAQAASVAINANEPLPELDSYALIADDIIGHAGPLAGVAAGLAARNKGEPTSSHLLTVAADTPFFPADLAERLASALDGSDDIAVAAGQDGAWHPVFALWPAGMEDDLRNWLRNPENRRLKAFIQRHPHRVVPFPLIRAGEGWIDPFFNINTPEDYRRALALRDQIS